MYSELQRVTTRYYKISTGKPQVVKLLIVKKKKMHIHKRPRGKHPELTLFMCHPTVP